MAPVDQVHDAWMPCLSWHKRSYGTLSPYSAATSEMLAGTGRRPKTFYFSANWKPLQIMTAIHVHAIFPGPVLALKSVAKRGHWRRRTSLVNQP